MLHTQSWFTPESTLHSVELLSEGRAMRLGSDVERLVLQRIIGTRDCPMCLAKAGQMCQVFGGVSELMRTHPLRMRMTRAERSQLVTWALRKANRHADVHVDEEVEEH